MKKSKSILSELNPKDAKILIGLITNEQIEPSKLSLKIDFRRKYDDLDRLIELANSPYKNFKEMFLIRR
jgi:flagellar motility protein MotE (MotC chaperone)